MSPLAPPAAVTRCVRSLSSGSLAWRHRRVLVEIASAQTVTMEAFMGDVSVCTIAKVCLLYPMYERITHYSVSSQIDLIL